MYNMSLNMKKFFNFQYRCIYTNVLIKPNQDHSKITKELFKDADDITVIKNHMQELRNSLEEQSTSLVSSLNCGDNELSRNSAKDCRSNLQKYFKMQSALITLYETQVKELKRTQEALTTESQKKQLEKEIEEMQQLCVIHFKVDSKDVVDSSFFDQLLHNFVEKCPLLHSVLQTILVTDKTVRVHKTPQYKLTCGINALSLLLSVGNQKCHNDVRLLLGVVCVSFGAGKQFVNFLNAVGLVPHWDTMYVF